MAPWRGARIEGGVEGAEEIRLGPVVALLVVGSVFLDTLLDGLLKLAGLEQGGSVGNTSDGLVRLKHHAGEADVELFASLDVQAQATEHEGDQTAGAGAHDEVEVFAWLGDLVSAGSAAFGFDKGSVHQLLDDDEDRVAADTSSI